MRIFFALFIFCGLAIEPTAQRLLRVEFVSEARGYRESVIFEKSTVRLQVNSTTEKRDSTFRMARKDWKKLQMLVNRRFLREMPEWEGIAGASAVDRARYSRVTIACGAFYVESRPFDNDRAPKRLMPIIELVRKYNRTKELE